ncbi:MAG: hypothetical protein BWY80_01149 [Firmicutes bacterium ADurb.Bin456]|nr:MAG: hypothetical protein BWY80_01149 [Firmicutes bacterium ADurb.Bin456]
MVKTSTVSAFFAVSAVLPIVFERSTGWGTVVIFEGSMGRLKAWAVAGEEIIITVKRHHVANKSKKFFRCQKVTIGFIGVTSLRLNGVLFPNTNSLPG